MSWCQTSLQIIEDSGRPKDEAGQGVESTGEILTHGSYCSLVLYCGDDNKSNR